MANNGKTYQSIKLQPREALIAILNRVEVS